MEQTVAPGKGLTTRQKQFLEVVLGEKYFLGHFYLSGGTALSSWYLHHRESFDLDLFSDNPFDSDKLTAWVINNKRALGYQFSHRDEDFGFTTFIFRYKNTDILKVDFNHYTRNRICPANIWRGLQIDSLYDIAVNKIQTIASSPRGRDYVDVFYIIKRTGWKISKLITDASRKFPIIIDPIQLSRNLLRVNEFSDFPKMLVPFSPKDMIKFYEDQARLLKKEIFK